ncbi:MAG TPA: vitamin K epoxide reductase family protein [Candidatus Dormibacteraeota bacterium]|nr:vitamin K epoxide reductase family protein [Candidatus Dormibacteraeota bacterium]
MFSRFRSLFAVKNSKLQRITIFGFVLSLLGIADATYLTVAHYTQTITLACPTTSFINCAKVTSSSYAEILGVPVALIGLIFFVLLTIIQLPIFWNNDYLWLKNPRLIFSGLGLIGVFWFIYVELDKLHAICLFCTYVHILTFLSFVTILFASEHLKKS